MEHQPVKAEALYIAPIKRVWEALTEKDQMKQWYFDMANFRPEPGFEFQFTGQGLKGQEYLHLCRITEVLPEKLLRHTWRYEGYPGSSEVSFELFEEGPQTRVILTHAGLESFPQDNADFARENFIQGWTYILHTSLKNYLEQNHA